jgi:hypothetical protein
MLLETSAGVLTPCHLVEICHISEEPVFTMQFSTLKLDTASSFEMLVSIYQTTQHHILENNDLNSHCCDNLRSHVFTTVIHICAMGDLHALELV